MGSTEDEHGVFEEEMVEDQNCVIIKTKWFSDFSLECLMSL